MRARGNDGKLTATLVAGTEVVMIALDIAPEHRPGLLGFSIWKRPAAGGDFVPLIGGRRFRGVASPAQGGVPLSEAPVQDFIWGDYVVEPGTAYVYRICAAHGSPGAIVHSDPLDVEISTENPDDGQHGVYFNRGVAASQSYSRRFGAYARQYRGEELGRPVWRPFVRPQDVPDGEALAWLSRGLGEAMEHFIRRAVHDPAGGATPRYSLRAAVYEFTHARMIRAFVDVLDSGADVKIIHHAATEVSRRLRRNPDASTTVSYRDPARDPVGFRNSEIFENRSLDGIASAAVEAVAACGVAHEESRQRFEEMLIPRANTTIQHNKFIVLLDNGVPIEVFTGSTNLTDGGIYGQSNVGHIVRDPDVAKEYLAYWERLKFDPALKPSPADPEGFAAWNVTQQPDPQGPLPPDSRQVIFSPRTSAAALDWYAQQFGSARQSVYFTTAFTVAKPFLDQATSPPAPGVLRYVLMESVGGPLREPYQRMRLLPANRIAWGDQLGHVPTPMPGVPAATLAETLTGLNDHVNYLHTKYMLVDPLSDDPVVISGSANFSDASTVSNDENMLVCRGDLRLADIFLTEFLRLFRHFASRNRRNALTPDALAATEFLDEDEHWSDAAFTSGSPEHDERQLFANAHVPAA